MVFFNSLKSPIVTQTFVRALSVAAIFYMSIAESFAQSTAVLAEVVQQSPLQNNYSTKTEQPRSKTPPSGNSNGGKMSVSVIKFGERGTFPDGSTLEPNGTITTPDGFKFQMIIRNKAMVGVQFFNPNGEKLKPGETLRLRNGKVFTQQGF